MALKTAIGLMSGTSMDGIDIALLKTDGKEKIERAQSAFVSYSSDVISQIKKSLEDAKLCTKSSDRPGNLQSTEELVTNLHIEAVNDFLADNNLSKDQIDFIGFHGQTVLHRPAEGYTIQLGYGEHLALETGIDCIYDMRANDMAFGGQGAPLVPIYHKALSSELFPEFPNNNICFVNIGGISNISYIGDELIAFDCGPGNALIDQWVQKHAGIPYDDGGIIAAEGCVNTKLAEVYLKDAFFDRSIPKSLDRNDFLPPQETAGSVEDVARTLAYVTAHAIYKSVEHLPKEPELWIMCGGGRHNPHIMHDLQQLAHAQNSKAVRAEEVGFNGDSMEAECWAYLSVRSSLNLPLTFPKTTGVSEPVSGGKLASV